MASREIDRKGKASENIFGLGEDHTFREELNAIEGTMLTKVPIFIPWEKFYRSLPIVMDLNENAIKLSWFDIAKSYYAYMKEMTERNKGFLPALDSSIENLLKEIENVFPGAKISDLDSFFTIGESEALILKLANELNVPDLLNQQTAPFLFSLSAEVRAKILRRIEEGGPLSEPKSALGFPLGQKNN